MRAVRRTYGPVHPVRQWARAAYVRPSLYKGRTPYARPFGGGET